MINYVEYLNVPTTIALALVGTFFVLQFIGELLEFKGKVVPEFMKIRKHFERKKREHDIISQLPELFSNANSLLNDVKQHYSEDNIARRDKWMNWVNDRADIYDKGIADLEEKMDKNNEIILGLLIDNKRNTIIDFASKIVDANYPATREQFNRIFKIYDEYEDIIEENELTNGEVNVAIHIIRESYEEHMRNHNFLEDLRGYCK